MALMPILCGLESMLNECCKSFEDWELSRGLESSFVPSSEFAVSRTIARYCMVSTNGIKVFAPTGFSFERL